MKQAAAVFDEISACVRCEACGCLNATVVDYIKSLQNLFEDFLVDQAKTDNAREAIKQTGFAGAAATFRPDPM